MLSECNTRQQHPARKAKTPKKAAVACLFRFPPRWPRRRLVAQIGCSRLSLMPPGLRSRTDLVTMGIVMKKMVLLATALALLSGSALAADMAVKAVKAPVPAPFDPWDIAFGSAIMNDYIFRGVTQSNHKPSVAAYFEPRYNVTKDLQLYIGTAAESISFANRAAAEVDVYGGVRPTFGAAAFDLGVWGYLYPGGQCIGPVGNCPAGSEVLPNGNVMKKDVSFFE